MVGELDFHECILADVALRKAARVLKQGFPRKRDEGIVSVTWAARGGKLDIGVPGATVEVPCLADRAFRAQFPFIQFRMLLKNPSPKEAVIRLGFAPGHMRIGNMDISSDGISMVASEPTDPLPDPPRPQNGEDDFDPATLVQEGPLDSALGHPLIGAYKMLRRYPDPTMVINATPQAIEARSKVEDIIRRASRSLKPLGVTRAHLEGYLDRHLGLEK